MWDHSGDVVTHDPIPHPVNWFPPGNWSLVCDRLKLLRKLWQSDSWDEQSQQPAQTKECHRTACAIPAGFPFFLEISSEASYQNVSTVCYTFLKTAVKSELSRWAAGVLDNPPTAPLCTLWYNTQCERTAHSAVFAYSLCLRTCCLQPPWLHVLQQEQLFHNPLIMMMIWTTPTIITW